MSQYSASVPADGAVKPEIKTFFEKFYAVSDTPDGHEKYADFFTKDGVLIMASNKVEGRDSMFSLPSSTRSILTLFVDIIKMRHGMWEKVAKRSHKPAQLYAFGSGSNDIMLYGTVDYTLKDGRSTVVEWSARAHFIQDDGDLKMRFYQVFLVRSADVLNLCQSNSWISGYRSHGQRQINHPDGFFFRTVVVHLSSRQPVK